MYSGNLDALVFTATVVSFCRTLHPRVSDASTRVCSTVRLVSLVVIIIISVARSKSLRDQEASGRPLAHDGALSLGSFTLATRPEA